MKKLLAMVLSASLMAGMVCMPVWADEDEDEEVVLENDVSAGGASAASAGSYTQSHQETSATPVVTSGGSGGPGMTAGGSQTAEGTGSEGSSGSRPPVVQLVDYPLECRVLKLTDYNPQEIKSAADETAAPLATAYYGEEYYLLDDTMADWYKVRYDGQEGYIRKGSGRAKTESTVKMEAGLETRAKVVEYAYQLLGGKYAFGGRAPESGLDCSGFALTVYREAAGIALAASSKEQAKQGTRIDISEIRPGDLIFYGADEASINHVAIYIGDNKIIHAQGTGLGVTVRPYDGRSDICCVVSILPN